MSARRAGLRLAAGIGAGIGYGSLLAFIYLIGMQTYRWFREGAWTHIGMGDGIRIGLVHCCVKDGGGGRLVERFGIVGWSGKLTSLVPADSLSPVGIELEGIGHILRDRRLDVPAYQRGYAWEPGI